MSSIIHLSQDNFDDTVMKASLPVLIDFWADWCMPCRMIAPVLEEIAKKHDKKLIVAKVNVDEEENLARQFAILSIPTLVLTIGGETRERIVGVQSKEALCRILETHNI